MRTRLILAILLWAAPVSGQSVHYRIHMPEPETHLFHVEMTIEDVGAAPLNLGLPAWNATYVIRNFAQYVQEFTANVPARRVDKQTWRIEPEPGVGTILVSYKVFADQTSPFSSELNEQHAFFNSANLLLLWKEQRDLPLTLEIDVPAGWSVATALPQGQLPNTFEAENYDHLVDSPVDIGVLDRYSFETGGALIHVIVDGTHRNYDAEELVSMLEPIVQGHFELVRDVPFSEYYFLYHFMNERAGGGMEHRSSTAIHRSFGPDERSVASLAGVSSHEFFHLWNVKRIRPAGMEPIDYFREDYSSALWFSEGFTSYYGDLVRHRVGLTSREAYYGSLARQIQTLQGRAGRLELSAADTSTLTWFDTSQFYRRPENSFSYYNKGLLIGLLLDLEIRDATDNTHSMDDVLRYLNVEYAQQGRFFDDRLRCGAGDHGCYGPGPRRHVHGFRPSASGAALRRTSGLCRPGTARPGRGRVRGS